MSRAKPVHVLAPKFVETFGAPDDPIEAVDARAQRLFPGEHPIVWQGDPATFQFSYISPGARAALGYDVTRWTREATFWADVVVHRDDRDGAVAYCALATAACCDHEFEYRARTVDGRVLWFHDIVRVIVGPKGVPVLLRGVMFDITAKKAAAGDTNPRAPRPSPDELARAS